MIYVDDVSGLNVFHSVHVSSVSPTVFLDINHNLSCGHCLTFIAASHDLNDLIN